MANYVKTITNSVNLFGLAPSTKWGQSFGYPYTMVWGSTKWGQGSFNQIFSVTKLISNSINPSTTIQLSTTKVLTNDLTINSDLSSEEIRNGSWSYVFPSNTIEGENRDFTSWTEGSDGSTTFTCQAAGSTTWS